MDIVERQFSNGSVDALTALHEARVLGDAKDPGPHALGLAKLVKTLENAQQRLLGDLFGIFAVAAHQPAILENPRPETPDETIKSFRIASQQITRQPGIILVHPLIVSRR